MANTQVDEPVLNIKNIQGNIIPGFNKDYQALLFLKIIDGEEEKKSDFENFRRWLGALAPRVTTMEHVLAFRSLLTEEERHGKPPKVKTTWINIAFSHAALGKLGAVKQGNDFRDEAFRQGLTEERAKEILGDPKGEKDEGNPKNWKVGGPDKKADIILIAASDDRLDLFNEVVRIGNSIYEPPGQSGVEVIFTQYGANLPGRREHFGFREGVSQPGVRGQISDNFGGYLTPRYGDESQGNPGLDLVWPGEFVFGYPDQDGKTEDVLPLARDGSFLVFRRLKQNVEAFHTFLRDEAKKLGISPDLFGAKCVGRWPSGTPILHAPEGDKESVAMAQDRFVSNDFTFKGEGGAVCPFAAHIRKMYPRDDVNESEMQSHRLLRRGIPYGEPSWSSPTAPYSDTVDRGLLFLAYQTSIVNQFEFLQQRANNPDFRKEGSGYDPIIGQNKEGGQRTFSITENRQSPPVELPPPSWVIPTGGGYFFAPSIEALHQLANFPKPKDLSGAAEAIKQEDWARIWAHAWLDDDPGFKDVLKRNPAKAAERFREAGYDLPVSKKLFNLVGDIYRRPFDRGSFAGMSFNSMSPRDLKEIAEKGTLHGKPFCVQPSEWVIVRRKKN